MKYLNPDFYDSFQCIRKDCPSTCCAGGWNIIIDQKTYKKYTSVSGEFGQRLKENMIVSDDNSSIKFCLTQDGRCPFLDSENLCEIFQNLGSENLCYTCQVYPRIVFLHGDILFRTLTLSCPEVCRILLHRTEPIFFDFVEDPSEKNNQTSYDWNRFNQLMSCFTFSIDLIQNIKHSLSARLRVLLVFTAALQNILDEKKDIAPLLETFSDPEYLNGQLSSLAELPSNFPSMFSAFLHFYQDAGAEVHQMIFPSFTVLMEKFIRNHKKEDDILQITGYFRPLMDAAHDIQYEHFCVLYLFHNYFNAYNTQRPLDEVSLLVYSLLITRGYALPFCSKEEGISIKDQITLFSSLSRIWDHNNQNRYIIKNYYEKDKPVDISFLLTLV